MLAEIIPEKFFTAMPILLLWLMSVVAIALLVVGADRAVGAAVRLARAMGMSTVIIGATVVSLGTTAPEAFVSVMAAFDGKSGLALGNGVGSIICNMALVFGLCSSLTRVPKDHFALRRYGWVQTAVCVLLVASIYVVAFWHGGIEGVVLSRWIGVGLCVLLVGYMMLSVRWSRSHPETFEGEAPTVGAGRDWRLVVPSALMLLFGLVLIIGGANVMVGSVGALCKHYGVPQSVLAVTLVAFGTSLPELVTGVVALIKGHPGLLVGNVMGANILNMLFVVGASATVIPLAVPPEFFYLHLPMLLVALVLFRLYGFGRSNHFYRRQGIGLVVLFAGYYAALLTLVLTGVIKGS
jgi:cation:H+ antiporter